jgi:hypothetical protein
MSQSHGSDKRAAFIGLVVTAVLLFLMSFTIVKLTSAHYAAKGEAAESTR